MEVLLKWTKLLLQTPVLKILAELLQWVSLPAVMKRCFSRGWNLLLAVSFSTSYSSESSYKIFQTTTALMLDISSSRALFSVFKYWESKIQMTSFWRVSMGDRFLPANQAWHSTEWADIQRKLLGVLGCRVFMYLDQSLYVQKFILSLSLWRKPSLQRKPASFIHF